MKNLFRKKALDHISSPDQLNNLMTFNSPGYWLSLIALGIIITSAIFWGIFGKISKEVNGTGIIVRSGGIRQVQAMGTGYLSTVNVKNGDFVEKGQPLAMIVQVETLENIRTNKDNLFYLKQEADQLAKLESNKQNMHLNSIEKLKKKYDKVVNKTDENLKLLEEITLIYKRLVTEKAISPVTYAKHLQELLNAEVRLADNQTRLLDLPYKTFLAEYEKRYSKLTRDLKIFDLENRQNSLLQMHVESSIVYSPISGRVLSLDVRAGDNVQNGTPLMNIIETGNEQNIEVLAYLSPEQGKEVKIKMGANVSPTITKPQRYGNIIGIVSDISQYPVTEKAMMDKLENNVLVKDMMKNGAPYRAIIQLVPSITNKSGYEWTSSNGPDFAIEPGTLCSISVSVEELAPISYVFPFMKKFLFGQ